MEILKATTENKLDLVRANNAVTAVQELKDKALKLTDIIIGKKPDENGEVKVVTILKVQDGKETYFASSISPTVADSVETIMEVFSADEIHKGVDIIVKSKKSKGGRDFFYIDLK